MSAATVAPTAKRRSWIAPGLVVLALLAHAAFMISVAVFGRDPQNAAEPDYYDKALAWDQTVAQKQRNAELGWKVEWSAEARPTLRLLDKDGRPVADAQADVTYFHQANSRDRRQATLLPSAEGYFLPQPLGRPGSWEVRLTVRKGELVFTDVSTLRVPGSFAP
jgi:nitrogen fixation protein FixH